MTQIKVLQHHIDQGVRQNPYQCAVALALRDNFPDVEYVSVCMGIHVGSKTYPTPEDVAVFVGRFDSNFEVEPFEFNLGESQLCRVRNVTLAVLSL